MMDIVIRLLLLGLVTGVSFTLVSWLQRRPVSGESGFAPGVTVFTGPGCALCGPVVHALGRVGVEPLLVDVTVQPAPGIRSLPTVVVADATGRVQLRRSGRAALDDVPRIADLSRRSLPGSGRRDEADPQAV